MVKDSREVKKRITREKLIKAASAEFAEAGYARANITRISERAGFGKGTVYNHFCSKYDLLLAVVEHAMELVLEEVKRAIADIDNPVEQIRRAIEINFEFMHRNEALSKVFVREGFAADPQRQREFIMALAPAIDFFVDLIEQGKNEDVFRKDIDSMWMATLADGMVAYMLLSKWALEGAEISYEQMADLTVKVFIEGIVAR
jgi:TetR/AcrR family fatty acid metabolism transcriptional regulator